MEFLTVLSIWPFLGQDGVLAWGNGTASNPVKQLLVVVTMASLRKSEFLVTLLPKVCISEPLERTESFLNCPRIEGSFSLRQGLYSLAQKFTM